MANTIVSPGNTLTARLNMQGADTLSVALGGAISVSAPAQSVRFNGPTNGATIDNSGTIENTASGGRAIRFETSVGATLNAGITNSGTIRSAEDAIQIQSGAVTGGKVTLVNSGTVHSIDGQAVDFAGGAGSFVTSVTNSGTIDSEQNDGVRVGGVGAITNSGRIDGGSAASAAASADGIQFEDNTSGTVDNLAGTISGDRHGINAGEGSTITVTNAQGAELIGRNGSGVGSDGTATIVNYGTITGSFTPGVDINSPLGGDKTDGIFDGDGDGVDVDFKATIENFGIIRGTGAGGNGSDGLPNTSEGIAAGGGTITNHEGALISGKGLGILIDDSSQGNAPFLTTIVNDGTISGQDGTGIRIVSDLDDTIVNSGMISGGNGVAIAFGSGDNTLFLVGSTAVVAGLADGGSGVDTIDYARFTGGVTVDLSTGAATGTGGVVHIENIVGSTSADTLTGSEADNVIKGGGGNDTIQAGAGNDRVDGGAGADMMIGGAGDDSYVFNNAGDTLTGEQTGGGIDTIWSTVTADLSVSGAVENLRLLGTADIDASGNALANLITGNAGSNVIAGGVGNDKLYGKGGADTFVFAEKGAADRDTIGDFGADDRIGLDAGVFSGLQANADGVLDPSSFALTAATGKAAQIVYNAQRGMLSYDANGAEAGGVEDIAFIGRNLAGFDSSDIFLV